MNELALTNEYNPTTKEKDIISVMVNPDNINLSITSICELAECSRYTYYKAFDKPEFVSYFKDQSASLVDHAVASIITAFVKEAKNGSYQHGKTLLEMAGLHTDKAEITGKNGGAIESNWTIEIIKPQLPNA